MSIYLIRHGSTEANEHKRYCGRTDLPLSSRGIALLQALRTLHMYPPVDAHYTSGMLRAIQTLKILYGDVMADSIPDLAEYDFGAFEMRNYEELRRDSAYVAWISDKDGLIACPGGESKLQCQQRVMRGFRRLLADLQRQGNPSAAIITHGGTIAQIMLHLFPDKKDFYEWQPCPGLGYILVQTQPEVFTYQTIHTPIH